VIEEQTGGLAPRLKTGRLRIAQSEMGQDPIAELNSFEVTFTFLGNIRGGARSKDHHLIR
jgi:hypothetical protein